MPRKEATAEELLARAKANGYERGAYREKDSIRDANRYVEKTKKIRIVSCASMKSKYRD
jgi:hypothetical protein